MAKVEHKKKLKTSNKGAGQWQKEPEKGRYARVLDKHGKSPEQYPDY